MKTSFIQSFKEIDRKFAFVFLADIAFYVALAIATIISLKIAATGVSAFYQIPIEMLDITKISEASEFDLGIEQTSALLQKFKTRITLSFALFWLLLIIAFTTFKGIAWGFVIKQRMNKKYFIQFFKLSFCWLAGTAALLLFVFWITKAEATGFLLLFIISTASYIIPVSCALFKPNKEIKELFKQAWHVGVERIYMFIIPTIASGILLLAALWILTIAGLFIQPTAVGVMMLFSIIAWQSWMKYYIYIIARGIK